MSRIFAEIPEDLRDKIQNFMGRVVLGLGNKRTGLFSFVKGKTRSNDGGSVYSAMISFVTSVCVP